MNEVLKIFHYNESFVKFDCSDSLTRELSEEFSFRIPNYRFDPRVKSGVWDGIIKLINNRYKTIPKGLLNEVWEWSKLNNYEMSFDDDLWKIYNKKLHYIKGKYSLSRYEREESVDLIPRDYQEEAVELGLSKKRCLILSPTASGKSLVIYLMMRELQENIQDKILIVVPTIGLVDQMVSDFTEYSSRDQDWDSSCIHKIVGGEKKNTEKQIIVSTWQSIYALGEEYFSQFGAIMVDEVHTFEAKSGSSIMNSCVNAEWRIGLTGTLADSKIHEMSLVSMFGPIFTMTTTKELIDRGEVSPLEINALVIRYSNNIPKERLSYQNESKWIIENLDRDLVFNSLCKKISIKENCLILVNNISHAKRLYGTLSKLEERSVFLVYGGTKRDDREYVRKLVDGKTGCIIVAIYKVFQAGVNIKNLHHIILGFPTKSQVRLLQSIGRGLRLSKDKDKCVVWDFVDDIRGGKKTKNYSIIHFEERYKIYMNQEFSVSIKEISI